MSSNLSLTKTYTHTHTHTFWTLQTSRTSSRLKNSRTGFLFSSSSLFHAFLAGTNPVPLTYPNKLLLALPHVRSAKQDLTLNSTESSLGLAMKQCAHCYTRGLWIHQCFSFRIIQISTAVKCFCFIFVCLFAAIEVSGILIFSIDKLFEKHADNPLVKPAHFFDVSERVCVCVCCVCVSEYAFMHACMQEEMYFYTLFSHKVYQDEKNWQAYLVTYRVVYNAMLCKQKQEPCKFRAQYTWCPQ